LLLDVFFEVVTIVATQSSPGLRLSIFIVFAADNVEIEVFQIVTLSLSLFTFKSIVAPSLGNVDEILTMTVWLDDKAAYTFADPGSISTVNAIEDSGGVGATGVGGVGVGLSPDLLHPFNTISNSVPYNTILKFINYILINLN
jgi:hypothetical protein